jgi:hypothetical protein
MKRHFLRFAFSGISLLTVFAIGVSCQHSASLSKSANTEAAPPFTEAKQPQPMESAFYTAYYQVQPDGVYRLPAGVHWNVMPRYESIRGPGRAGVHVEDRVTVVLQDDANQCWPLIVKMSTEDAENLQHQLASVIAEKKHSVEKRNAGMVD